MTTTCPKCGTNLKNAPGIGPYCPNKECDVSDGVDGTLECLSRDDEIFNPKPEDCSSWEEMFPGGYKPLTRLDKIEMWFYELPYTIPKMIRNICRWLFWPKCDICGKPAYFEHCNLKFMGKEFDPSMPEGWFYVCWECSFKYKGYGSVE